MRGFDARFIEELKNKNDIVDIIGRYGAQTFGEDALSITKKRRLFRLTRLINFSTVSVAIKVATL